MTKEASRQGLCLSSSRASHTASKRCSTSPGHRLQSLPYFAQLHTHSSGSASGSWAGKSSTTTRGCFASHALTALDLLWILLPSHTTVHAPGALRSRYARNSTTSSPWKFWLSRNQEYRPTC